MGLKTLQKNLRIGVSYLYLFLTFSFFFLSQHDIYGQCIDAGVETINSPVVSTGIGSQPVNNVAPGEYILFYVCAGESYSIGTCGETDFNTEITLRDETGALLVPGVYNNDDGPGCAGTQASVDFTATTTGYIQVYVSWDDDTVIVGTGPCSTSFILTTTVTLTQNTGSGCAPPGYNCTSPYLLTDANIGTAITGLTTEGFGDDYSTSPCTDMTNIEGGAAAANDYMDGDDFVFTFTPSTTDCYLFSATNTDDFAGIFVLDDCPDVATTCLGVAGSSDNTTHVSASLTGGTQYYIVVSSWPAPQETAFDFLVSTCDGLDCANPYVLTGGAPITETGLTTEGYGDDYSASPCTADDAYIDGEDFIIEFTPTATGCHTVALSNTDTFVGLFVLDGCPDNGATSCIGSVTETGGNPSLNVALTASTTYTIVVSTDPAPDFTPFDLSIVECSNTGATCAEPYAITAPTLPHTENDIDLCGLATDYDDTDACGNFYMYGEDIVMTYTPTTTDCYSFELTATANSDPTADIGLFILTGCPDDPATICVSQETADNSFPTANANLTANEEYYIVVAASEQATAIALNSCTEFNLTIDDGATGCPAGATCSDPYIITAPSFPHVEPAIDLCGLGNDYGQTNTCESLYMFGEDIVMTFTPTATDCYSIALSGTADSDPLADIGMFIMSGCPDDPQSDCIAQEEVDNSFPTIDIYMDASVTYYIVIAASEQAGALAVNSCTEFDLTINNGSLNCPAGPNCANPLVITAPSFPHTEAGLNSCGTGNDYDNTDACGSTYMNGEDIVMTFTPTVTDCYNFTANNISNAAADMGLFILNGCPDDLTASCLAQDEVDNGSPTTDAYLNAGETYYIVVSAVEFAGPIANSSCTEFDLVIANGSLNCPGGAVCSNPHVIAPAGFPHTEAGLTSCGFGNDYDNTDACGSDYMEGEEYVMTFTPTTTDCYNFLVSNTTTDTDVGLFVLTDCPDSGSASCIAQDEVDNGGPTADAYLTAGETYYIVVSAIEYDFLGLSYASSCTDFDLTINTGGTNCPFGAICSNSDVIPSLPYSQTGLTTCGFGDDYSSADGCGSVYMNGDDYVFSFTPTVTDCYNIDITNTGNNPTGLFVLDNCPDALAANCVAINEDDDFDGEPSVTTDLQAGITYYIIVSTDAALIGGIQCTPFDISMTQGCPTGTTCASANVIASSPATFSGLTTCGAGYDYDDTEGCGGNYMTGEDYIFEFTPSTTECFLLSLSNATDATADWGLFVTDGCPDDPTATCVGQITADNNTPGIDLTLTGGTTYYITVDTWSTPDCSGFDFNIAPCPASVIEQDCIGAIPVCQDTYNQPNSYVGEGDIPNEINTTNSCLFDGERNDVWYLITIQSDGNFNFEIQPANVDDDYDWAVYDLTNNVCADIFSNPGIEISCNYSLLPGTTGTSNLSAFTSQGSAGTNANAPIPVVAGDILVLNISNFSSTQDGYTLDLNPPLSPSTAGIFDNVAAEFSAVDPNIPCGATTLDVTFSDPVLCNTVEACDFELTGPGGPYTITAVSGGNCTDPANDDLYERDFTLTIDPPLIASGDFTIALVPAAGSCGSITDKCDNIASNGENIAFTLDNVSASITAQTDANCGDTAGSVTVEGANGNEPYQYSLDGGTFQASGTFTGLAGGTYVVTTLDDIGCEIDIDVTIINNGTIPDATASNDSPVCEGTDVNLTSSTTTVGTTTTYAWSGPNSFGSGDQNPVLTGTTTADAGTYTVTITVDGCSATATTDVTINALPTPSFTLSDTEVCADGTSTITVTYTGSGSAGATYNWSFGGGDATPGTGQGPHDVTWSSGTGNVDITLEVTENGCVSATETQSITLSEPLETPIVTCPTSTENSVDFEWQDITGATGYDISYTINSGAATTINNHPDSDYQVTGLSPADQVDITITAIGPAPCGNSAVGTGTCDAQDCPTVNVTIDNLNAAYCEEEAAFTLQGTPAGGTFSGTGVSGGQFDPAAAGVGGPYTITYDYTDTGTGCDYSTTLDVTVNAVPSSTFTLSETEICADGTSTITVTYTGSAGTGATYNWNFGGGTAAPGTGQGPHTVSWSSGTGSVNITLDVTENSCTSNVTTESLTLSEPLATPIINCPGSTETSVDFEWQDITGATGYDISYTINSGAATTINNHPDSDYQVTGLTAGDQVDITVIALGPAPCGNSAVGSGTCDAESCATVNVTIDNLNAAYCEDEVAFTLQGTPAGGTFSGTGVSGGQFDPAAAGVGGPYTITYDYTDTATGCDYSTTLDVTVNAVPSSTFTLSETEICADGTSTTTVTYTGSAGTGATYNWNFGGGTAAPGTGQGPHTVSWSSGTGSVNITLDVTENGCTSNVATESVTLSEPLVAPNITCTSTPNSVSFNWQDIAGATGYTITYTINSGAPTNATSATSDFDVNGLNPLDEVDITITANGPAPCGDGPSSTSSCIAEDCPTVISIDNLNATYCENEAAFTLQGTPAGGTFSGTGVSGGQFDPSAAGVGGPYTITYEVTEGACDYSTTGTVTINTVPTSTFTLSDTELCADGSSTITITYTGSSGTGATYNWNFAGGAATPGTGQGPHTVSWSSGTGSVNITLDVTENGCTSDVSTESVTLSEPLATPVIVCGTTTTNEVNFDWQDVTGATSYDISYTINSGTATTDNSTSSDYQVTGLTAGDQVDITVIAIGPAPCGNSEIGAGSCDAQECLPTTITIDNLNASYCENQTGFTLQGTPSGGTFSGTGVSGGQFNPGTAGIGGPYTITYDYTDPATGCDYQTTSTVSVNEVPTSTFNVNSMSACADGTDEITVTYQGIAPVGSTFNWNFGGGNASPGTGEGPHTVTWPVGASGISNITLVVSSNGCDSGSSSQQITLTAPLATPNISCTSTPNSVSFNWQDISGATGYTITYTINSGSPTNATSSTSDFDINGLNPLDEVAITVVANGPAPCGESAAGTGNCTAEDCPTVISIDNLSGPYCTEDAAITLAGTPTGGTFSGTGVLGGQFDPALAGAGTHTVTYDVSEGDCDYTISQQVTVNESPTADFTLSDTEVCADGSSSIVVTYTGNGGTGATYNWNFGSASASPGGTTQGPHTLSWNGGTGSVNILLSVTQSGCSSASNSQSVNLSAPLTAPTVTCGSSTTSEVNFDWGDVAGATGYSISYTINSGAAVTDNSTNSDYQVTGLNPNDIVDITVIAEGPAPCGDSAASTATCVAEDCPTNITPSITNLNANYCEDDGVFTLQATPTGGTFSGTGVTGAQFNPGTAGAGGPYTITYDYTDPASGCDYQATAITSINAVPTSTFTLSDSQLCADGSQSIVVTYTGTASASGSYNWNFGGGDASPGTGQGPHTVTWSSGTGTVNITLSVSENGCDSDITSQSVTLSSPLSPPTINCNNAATTSTLVAFDWNDVGGATGYAISYTVNGGSPTSDTSTSSEYEVSGLTAGDNVTLTVVATGVAPCGDSASSTATCQAQDCPDAITIDNLSGPYCSDEAAFTLQGTPTGGTFSGTGVSGGQFDPSIGAGSYTITYDYTDTANGCEYTTNQSVTVNTVPTSDFTVSPSDLCADGLQSTTVTYTGGAGTGATYNWNFGGGTAIPGTGRGPHTVSWTSGTTANITLTVTANGCTSPESSQNVTLSSPLDAPTISCGTSTTSEVNFDWADIVGATGYSISYTINNGPATTASSATSDYQVTGLNPLDEVTITVIAEGPAPCGNSAAGTGICIAEDCPTISPSIGGLNASYCADASIVALTGTPSGGTFSGTGISGSNFDPATAGAGGPYTITYDYTDSASGCDYQTTQTVTVNPVPVATFTVSPDPICADGSSVATVTFTGTAGAGSTYNWNFGGGNASPGGNVAGPHVVTWDSGTSANLSLTVTQNGCVSPAATESVTLAEPLAAPSVNCTGSTTSSVSFDWADIVGATSYDISYTLNGGAGTTDNTTTSDYEVTGLTVNDVVVITVIAVGPAPCGNSLSGTAQCEALDCPTQNLTITGLDATYCADASEVNLTGTPAGGTFSGTGVNSGTGTFNPGNAGVGGPYTITYTFVDPTAPDCDYSTTSQVTVRAVPTSDFVINPSDICADGLQSATVTYTGSAGTGASYNWNFGGGTAVPGGNVQGPHTVTWASGSGSVAISLSVTANTCNSEPTSQNVNLSSPLATPTVSCGTSTTNSVSFDWADITGSTGYEVSYTVNGGTAQNDNTTASSYTVTGLDVNDGVTISVVAVGPAPCGNSAAGSQTCTAEDCPDISPTISGLDGEYCSDAGTIALTGTPAGGTFSGPGISGNSFDPSNAGSGLITIVYDYAEGDCSYTTSQSTTISEPLSAPTVTCGTTTTNSVEFTWTAVTGATDYNITISGAATDNQTISGTSFTVTGLAVNDEVTIVVEPIGAAPCGNGPTGTTTCTAEDCVALPNISIDNLNVQYCADDAVVDPILATPAGGVFSGAGIVGNSFDPSTVGAANTTILYTYTDPATDCEYTTTFAVTILPPYDAPVVECGTSSTSSVSFNWNNVGTNDYVVSYTIDAGAPITENVTGTTFTVGSLTTGSSVSISVVALGIPPCGDSEAGTATCVAEDCAVINPTITGLSAAYCSDETAVNLTVEPAGGILSGAGVTGNSFDPASAGTGAVTLTYDYTDPSTGCSYQTTASTTISEPLGAPTVTCGTTTPNSIIFNWTAVTGATGYNISWSGAATGSQTLTDLTFELTGLTANDEVTIVVEPIGDAPCGNGPTGMVTCTANDCPAVAIVISGLEAQYCGDDGVATLSASPTGGTFSGPGVSGNTFDPSAAGQTSVTIVYDYTDPNNADCTYQQPISTTVLPPYGVPTVTCGTGTTSSVSFTWEDVGSASYQVTLSGAVSNSFTTGGTTHTESGLNEGDEVTITVVALGEAPCGDSEGSTVTCTAEACQPVGISLSGLDALYCSTDGAIALTGIPAGGTFVGAGITGNNFDPAVAGVGGPYTILYDYTDAATGCDYQVSATVSVSAPLSSPTVICSDESLNSVSFEWAAIAGASQYELIISINNVPSSAQITSNTDYTESGLSSGDVVDISIVALGSPPCGNSPAGTAQCTARDCPDVVLSLDLAEQYCGRDPAVTLTPSPSGGTLSGPGISGTSFDPFAAGVGVHTVVYTYTEPTDGCNYQESFETTVLPPSGAPVVSCASVSMNSITFEWADVGTENYEITLSGAVEDVATVSNTSYTVTGLSAGASVTIQVIALNEECGNSEPASVTCTTGDCGDTVMSIVGLDGEYCSDAGDVVLTVVDQEGNAITGGSFSGDGIVGGLFQPSQGGTGSVTLAYNYTDAEGCDFVTTATTTIVPALIAPTVICAGTTVTSVAFTWDDVGAGMYNVVVTVNGTETDNISASTLSFDKTGLTAGDEVGISVVAVGTAPCGDSEAGIASCTAQDCGGSTPTIDNLLSEYCGATSSTFTLTGTPAGGTFSGPGVTGDSFDPSAAGQSNVTIVYTVTDTDGCVYQSTASTEVLPPFDVPTINCAAVTTNSVSVEWSDVGSAEYRLTIQVNGGTVTTQTVSGTTYTETGLNVSDEVTITVVAVGVSACGDSEPSSTSCIAADCPALVLNIEGLAEAYCTGDPAVTLTATLDGLPANGGNFIGAAISGGNTINPEVLPGGLYLISYVYNEPNGCQYIATESFSIGGVTGDVIGVDSPIIAGNIAPLSIDAFSATGGDLTYEWSPSESLDCTDCISVNATPTQTTTYEVLVTDSEGCNRLFSTIVEVNSDSNFTIPTAFTPNGDGDNDVFAPEAKGVEEITFQVFSRWGEKMHDVTASNTDGADFGWDGTYKDELLPIGSYVYVVIITYRDGEQGLERGSFQLLR